MHLCVCTLGTVPDTPKALGELFWQSKITYVPKQRWLRTIPWDGDVLVKLPPSFIIHSLKHQMTALRELYIGQFGETYRQVMSKALLQQSITIAVYLDGDWRRQGDGMKKSSRWLWWHCSSSKLDGTTFCQRVSQTYLSAVFTCGGRKTSRWLRGEDVTYTEHRTWS